MANPQEAEAELENFRRRWKEEVSARSGLTQPSRHSRGESAHTQSNADRRKGKAAQTQPAPSRRTEAALTAESGERTYHDLPDKEENLKLGAAEKGFVRSDAFGKEPRTALEHYEKAVETEAAGKLGDSLKLYRRAFKLDDNVHERYKNKHFPPSASSSKPIQSNPSNTSATVPNTAHHSLHGSTPSISQLIQDFSNLAIPAIEPPTDASPQPPCPIADLPGEMLSQVLHHAAQTNVASFARLSLVCKRFAYLTMTEEQIWKAVVLSQNQGFGNMHYEFACDVYGKPIDDEDNADHVLGPVVDNDTTASLDSDSSTPSFLDISNHILTSLYASSWRQMFRQRPRIRFHGVYISTVNYTRPGGASATSNTWFSPVHVVTYYRYLRFYRDGTCVSLLTTAEPIDVVHNLSKENLPEYSTDPSQSRRLHNIEKAQASRPPATSLDKSGSAHAQAQKTEQTHALPSSQVMKDALRGRWRLSGPGDGSYPPPTKQYMPEAEGDLHVETEGVIPKYMYKMQFAIGSSSMGTAANTAAQAGQTSGGKRGSRNNRLTWKGFWSYNRLTDDWGEFGLKNDRAFYFSRVKSYGMGG